MHKYTEIWLFFWLFPRFLCKMNASWAMTKLHSSVWKLWFQSKSSSYFSASTNWTAKIFFSLHEETYFFENNKITTFFFFPHQQKSGQTRSFYFFAMLVECLYMFNRTKLLFFFCLVFFSVSWNPSKENWSSFSKYRCTQHLPAPCPIHTLAGGIWPLLLEILITWHSTTCIACWLESCWSVQEPQTTHLRFWSVYSCLSYVNL